MNFKKGDTVKVLAGRDKNKTGKVVAVDYKKFVLTVDGVNLLTRHQRPRKAGQKGQKVRLPAAMHPGKVMLICPSCGKPTRVGHKVTEAGAKLRACKKCKSTF